MLKKFTTLLCVGALSVAFVGCEQAGDTVDATGDAAAEAVEGAEDAAAGAMEEAEEGAEAVEEAASGE